MIRIGVVGTSSISERRMIPAILKNPAFQYAGVAYSTRREMNFPGSEEAFAPLLAQKREKAERFQRSFGGEIWEGYEALLAAPGVDAVYIALPPALHAHWIRRALESGKHVLSEKPFTTSLETARELTRLAREKGLAMIENYGFPYHGQMEIIRKLLEEGAMGDLRLVRASFGFPHREATDFRYDKALGGGALLDCGGYTVKAAATILGPEAEVVCASAVTTEGHEVDVYGSATLRRPDGLTAQLAWGMDQAYRCELELWGSQGIVTAPRFYTAPDGFDAPVILKRGQETTEYAARDDQFLKIVNRFEDCIDSEAIRLQTLEEVLRQSELTEQVRQLMAE